ncbi:MarR family winged helix-turn-helix transcriptional regulator [Saccharomonospora xinjiangensis]|uniref:Transcriptional regulator n=1 Tax=Saccharomonospora xinjiangensis XJ-54 TaxID=882086 RepID=I0V4T9_9PSEU|nr:MarR family transcriptional regulator [Saccharomonospora xinjiangensis]EID55142.1 transcriptional regulator [Saccharomonospora xinjiangensis XJ-54]
MRMQISAEELSSAWSQVAVFASAVDASLGKWLTETYRLGLTEYRALAHLAKAPDRELRVNDLAYRVGLNQSSVTRLVSRLETKGLAFRDVCPDDGRGVYAVLTEQGESLLRDVRGPYGERVRELLGDVAARYPQVDAGRLSRALIDVSDAVSS